MHSADQIRGGPLIVLKFMYVVQRNFLHYRALDYEILIITEVEEMPPEKRIYSPYKTTKIIM